MTTDETPSVRSEALSSEQVEAVGKRVEAVEQQVAALAAAQSAARKTRLVLPIGFLIFVCIFCFLFVRLKDEFMKKENLNEVGKLAQERLEGSLLDQLQRQAERLVEETRQPLTDAFTEQVEKDTPKYSAAISKEGEVLFENLESGLEEQLNKHTTTILEQHRDVLKQEFPDLTDEQLLQLAENIEKAGQQLVKKYYVDNMQVELEQTLKLVEEFPVADPPGPGAEPLEKELINCLLEIIRNPQDTLLDEVEAEVGSTSEVSPTS